MSHDEEPRPFGHGLHSFYYFKVDLVKPGKVNFTWYKSICEDNLNAESHLNFLQSIIKDMLNKGLCYVLLSLTVQLLITLFTVFFRVYNLQTCIYAMILMLYDISMIVMMLLLHDTDIDGDTCIVLQVILCRALMKTRKILCIFSSIIFKVGGLISWSHLV